MENSGQLIARTPEINYPARHCTSLHKPKPLDLRDPAQDITSELSQSFQPSRPYTPFNYVSLVPSENLSEMEQPKGLENELLRN